MKKLLSIALASFILVGCGSGEETKKLTCVMDQEAEGLSLKMKIIYEYKDKTIYKQDQTSTITSTDGEIYDQLYSGMEVLDFKTKVKDMKGVTYKLSKDDEKLEIIEKMNIDFGNITADDYKVVTNGASTVTGDKKILLDLDKTIESSEAQGLTCTK